MICWDCHWGWPEKVADIYEDALKKLGEFDYGWIELQYGQGHVVWGGDENFDSAQWCLDNYNKEFDDNLPDEVHDIVIESLTRLARLTPDEINACPDDYDGVNPQNFPPTRRVRKVV